MLLGIQANAIQNTGVASRIDLISTNLPTLDKKTMALVGYPFLEFGDQPSPIGYLMTQGLDPET